MSGLREKKRKREDTELAKKRVKLQKKTAVGSEGEVKIEDVATPPVARPQKKKEKKREEGKTQSESLVNEVGGEISAPPSARKEKEKKKKSKAPKAETPVGTVADNEPEQQPSKQAPIEYQPQSQKLSRPQKPPAADVEGNPSHIAGPGKSEEQSKKKSKKHKTGQEVGHTKTSGIGSSESKRPKKKQKSRITPSWSISAPLGGWFLPQCPVFSADEKHLILANARALHIYSTETSLIVKEFPLGSGYLLTYALSSTDPNRIYMANSEGRVALWDWADGKQIGRWDIGSNARRIHVVCQPQSEQDLVYSHEAGTRHIVNIHALRTKENGGQTEFKQIFNTKSPIIGIQVLLEGKIVVITTRKSVAIGKRTKLHKTALQDFEYTWREFQTAKRITCSNALARATEETGKAGQPSQGSRDHLDFAIGDEDGVIYVFEDILSSFTKIEKAAKGDSKSVTEIETLRPNRLHWHRNAVGSVKWSRDGNYLISGGDETVLVLWQLSTGKQQHLPHLTAAIENIVVSPTGSAYAITLANNSVIVLSTSELVAKTNIIGIQSRRIDLEQMPRETGSSDYSFELFTQIPMVVDPKNVDQVLFTMPSSQPRHRTHGVPPEPYIQTFDIASQRPVARQSLTRNNATDPNMGPDGGRILEPNIRFMQISHDGKWLATVDEWIPPLSDMGYIGEGVPELNKKERTLRREVYLKFWRWDETNTHWALDSRIDAPHFSESISASARVLDLVADPAQAGFATVGEDRFVRIWRPKTRMWNGITVRGADKNKGQGLVTWSLHRSVGLSSSLDILDPTTNDQSSLVPYAAHLSFSSDGSVLAAGISFESDSDPGAIHIVDATVGIIKRSLTELDVTAFSCLGILGRHLIVVADSVTVWDLVADELVYSIPFDCPGVDCSNRIHLVRLAINEEHGTFAVSRPKFETNGTRYFKKASSKVSIFDPYQRRALWSRSIPDTVLSLISAKASSGYIALDSNSSIRLVSPKAGALQLITPPPETSQQLVTDIEQTHESDIEEEISGESGDGPSMLAGNEDLLSNSENDKPVVRPEQLQEIFDIGPSHALPPVKDLFNAVVGLYARKPRAVGVA